MTYIFDLWEKQTIPDSWEEGRRAGGPGSPQEHPGNPDPGGTPHQGITFPLPAPRGPGSGYGVAAHSPHTEIIETGACVPALPAVRPVPQEIHAAPVAAGLPWRTRRVTLAGVRGRVHAVPIAADQPGGTRIPAAPAVGRVIVEVPADAVAAGLHRGLGRAFCIAGPAVEVIGLEIAARVGTAPGLAFRAGDAHRAVPPDAVLARETRMPALPAVLLIHVEIHAHPLAVRGSRSTGHGSRCSLRFTSGTRSLRKRQYTTGDEEKTDQKESGCPSMHGRI